MPGHFVVAPLVSLFDLKTAPRGAFGLVYAINVNGKLLCKLLRFCWQEIKFSALSGIDLNATAAVEWHFIEVKCNLLPIWTINQPMVKPLSQAKSKSNGKSR